MIDFFFFYQKIVCLIHVDIPTLSEILILIEVAATSRIKVGNDYRIEIISRLNMQQCLGVHWSFKYK